MDRIDTKLDKLESLRRQVARYRRLVLVVLLVEIIVLTGLVLSNTAGGSPGAPPTVQS